ncbi:hypothetical protein Q5752_006180 [Cryptotrichosporon argae]
MAIRDVLRLGRHRKSHSTSSASSADSPRTPPPAGSPVLPPRTSLSREVDRTASESAGAGNAVPATPAKPPRPAPLPPAHDGVVVIGPDPAHGGAASDRERGSHESRPDNDADAGAGAVNGNGSGAGAGAQSPTLPALPPSEGLAFDPATHVSEADRPPPVVAASAAPGGPRVGGEFRHVQSVLAAKDKALPDTPGAYAETGFRSEGINETSAVPAKSEQLSNAEAGPSHTSQAKTAVSPSAAAGLPPFVARRDWDVSVDAHLAPWLEKLNLGATHASAQVVPGTLSLEVQREAMVERLFDECAAARAARGEVSAEGREVFVKAGLGERLGEKDTVDVYTQWLEPVVHEYIRPVERNFYTTVIHREVNKHHVYPKIQPIADPDPIRLPARHRIFSPVTNAWHEVDEATAREALGAAFDSGAKEVREERRLALPDWRDGVCDVPYENVQTSWVVPAKEARHEVESEVVGQAV